MSRVRTARARSDATPLAGTAQPPPAQAGDAPEAGSPDLPGRLRISAEDPANLERAFVVAIAATVVLLVASFVARTWTAVSAAATFLMVLCGLAVLARRALAVHRHARHAAELEAAASHNQLQKLIDNSSAVIYMKRIDDGQYLLVNREWERLFGVSRDRVVSLTDREVFPPALADQLRSNDLGVAKAGTTVQYEESAEAAGVLRTYVSVKFPVLDSAGEPYAVCGISTDITERKRAESEVHRLNADLEARVRERTAELEASTRELDAFAYSVSHDLRAPLRSLHGFSDALLEDYVDVLDAEGLDYLRRIQHNVQRMGRMIDDLLNLSRATRVEILREVVDMTGIAREILAELAAAEPARTVRINVSDGLRAYGDPQLIRLALQNLLANAWKFTNKRIDAVIEVGHDMDDGEEMLVVRDNGAGFDMQYVDKLFNAFQRLHPAAEFEGTGIGLAIVARVVRRHGGRILAYAEIDRGATFSFNFTSKIPVDPAGATQPALERTNA